MTINADHKHHRDKRTSRQALPAGRALRAAAWAHQAHGGCDRKVVGGRGFKHARRPLHPGDGVHQRGIGGRFALGLVESVDVSAKGREQAVAKAAKRVGKLADRKVWAQAQSVRSRRTNSSRPSTRGRKFRLRFGFAAHVAPTARQRMQAALHAGAAASAHLGRRLMERATSCAR